MSKDDPQFEDTVVAFLEIKMRRSGLMSVAGTITDEQATLALLDTARATMVENFARQKKKLESDKPTIIVPGYDTALTGSEYEKKLIRATSDLHEVRERCPVTS